MRRVPRSASSMPSGSARRTTGSGSTRRSRTTSTRRTRSRSCTTGRRPGRVDSARGAGSTCSGSTRSPSGPKRLREVCARQREHGRAAREDGDFAEADRLRGEIARARLGGTRSLRPGRRPARPRAVTAELVYGRRAVREALRGRREVLELLATERAARDGWERKPKIVPERALTELAGTRDHQGVVARVEPFRYADAYELAAGEPLLVCLDQVTDPRNLGAVIRSAEGAGATGVILPAHNSARVTPAVARSSAGAVEHLPVAVVPNLARYLNEVKGPRLWVWAADADGTPMAEADLAGGLTLVFGAEGKGLRPLVRRACDGAVSIPLAGQVESLNVSVAAAVLLYEARRQRGAAVAEPTLYLFDGYNLLHAGGYADVRGARRPARQLRRACRARAAWSSSTASARTSTAGRSRCATRRTRTRCSSGSPPSTATARRSASSRRTRSSAAPPAARCGSSPRRTFLRDLADASHQERSHAPARASASTRRRALG